MVEPVLREGTKGGEGSEKMVSKFGRAYARAVSRVNVMRVCQPSVAKSGSSCDELVSKSGDDATHMRIFISA